MFNTEELYEEAGSRQLRRRGKEFTTELRDKMMGRPGPVALQIMIDWHQLDVSVEELQQETEAIFDDILEQQLAPLPGLLPLLDFLESCDKPKAIATSSQRRFVDRVLTISDLHSRFEFALTSDDIVHGKPAPEIYLAAAARLQVRPENMLVLEDSTIGSQAAVAAGAIVVAVPGEHSRHQTFPDVHLFADTLADPQLRRMIQGG